jgi:hypothetical protein
MNDMKKKKKVLNPDLEIYWFRAEELGYFIYSTVFVSGAGIKLEG